MLCNALTVGVGASDLPLVCIAVFQYVVITVCVKAGLETSAWTYVSGHASVSRVYSDYTVSTNRVTSFLEKEPEKLEMLGNLTTTKKISGNWPKVGKCRGSVREKYFVKEKCFC